MPLPRYTYPADAAGPAGQRIMRQENNSPDVSMTDRTSRPTSPVPMSEDTALHRETNDAGSPHSLFSDPSDQVRQALLVGYCELCGIYGDEVRQWVRDVLVAGGLIDSLDLVHVLFRSHNSNHITRGVRLLERILSRQPASVAMRLRVHPNTIPVLTTFSRMLDLVELTPERTLWANLIEAHTGFYVGRIAAGLSGEDTSLEPPATVPARLIGPFSYDRTDSRLAQNSTRDLPLRNRVNSQLPVHLEFAGQTNEAAEVVIDLENINAESIEIQARDQHLVVIIHPSGNGTALNSLSEPSPRLATTQLPARHPEGVGFLGMLPHLASLPYTEPPYRSPYSTPLTQLRTPPSTPIARPSTPVRPFTIPTTPPSTPVRPYTIPTTPPPAPRRPRYGTTHDSSI